MLTTGKDKELIESIDDFIHSNMSSIVVCQFYGDI